VYVYALQRNHLVDFESGEDVDGRTSGVIAPHGICALWEPNEEEIRQADETAMTKRELNVLKIQ
jgi:hypothetical protein